jgi:glutathione reductase (NADPH)
VGGTCVIRGCVPKKLMVYASEFGHAFEEARGFGWKAGEAHFDWKTLIANKDDEIDRLNGIYIRTLRNAGVDIFETRAVVKDPHTVHLVKEGRDVTAKTILVATGGAPWTDEAIPGHELAITSNEAFHLKNLPRHVVIAGGGYIAIEFACIFKGLGADVSLVYRGDTLLRLFDRDVSAQVRAELDKLGVKVLTGALFERIEALGGEERRVHLSTGEKLDADLVFWAVGRRPATAGLGLEAAGVKLGKGGAVIVDEFSKSSADSIYAIGDVTDRVNLTPVAIREGAAFAETCFNNNPQKMDYAFIPQAVFAQPPVGVVGYTEKEAREKFGRVDIYRTEFRPMKATLSGSQQRMMMKLVVDAETGRVLGCHIVGEGAPEMIQCLAIAIKAGVTKRQFDDTCALHPTAAEELVTLRDKFVPKS